MLEWKTSYRWPEGAPAELRARAELPPIAHWMAGIGEPTFKPLLGEQVTEQRSLLDVSPQLHGDIVIKLIGNASWVLPSTVVWGVREAAGPRGVPSCGWEQFSPGSGSPLCESPVTPDYSGQPFVH